MAPARFRIVWLAACLLLIALVKPAIADNAVKLRILVITAGEVAEDMGFAYIKPFLDEMGVPYDVLNARAQDLTVGLSHFSSPSWLRRGGGRLRGQLQRHHPYGL